jgi:hypothetical protein
MMGLVGGTSVRMGEAESMAATVTPEVGQEKLHVLVTHSAGLTQAMSCHTRATDGSNSTGRIHIEDRAEAPQYQPIQGRR